MATRASLVAEGDHAFFRTYDAAGKSKRLRNFPQVRATPCALTGKPTGPALEGSATKLDGAVAEHARSLLAGRYRCCMGGCFHSCTAARAGRPSTTS